jgi:hypothetical protein
MAKSYRREIKQKVGEILHISNHHTALEMLKQIPDKQLVGNLFSYFYNKDELIKFRSVTAMGRLAARVEQNSIEQARIILRRIMWNLNDESGGIGWGSPEAMGDILCQSAKLAIEFKSILFSYLAPQGNFIEHEMLQRGVIWGVGRYLESNPKDLDTETTDILLQHLFSFDPVKKVYALKALIHANYFDNRQVPGTILTDHHKVDVFKTWYFTVTSASDLAQMVVEK